MPELPEGDLGALSLALEEEVGSSLAGWEEAALPAAWCPGVIAWVPGRPELFPSLLWAGDLIQCPQAGAPPPREAQNRLPPLPCC